jgi:hypothetical protein
MCGTGEAIRQRLAVLLLIHGIAHPSLPNADPPLWQFETTFRQFGSHQAMEA